MRSGPPTVSATVRASRFGRKSAKSRRHLLPGMIAAPSLEPGQHVDLRRHVDDDVAALAPIRRYLQDRRPAQAAVGEQQRFVETRLAAAHDGFDRNARHILESRQQRRIECQGHQRRARRHHLQAELLGNPVSESTRPHFRNRRTAGRDHQRCGAEFALIGDDDKTAFTLRHGRDTRRPAAIARARCGIPPAACR